MHTTAPSPTTAQLPHHLLARIAGLTHGLSVLGISVQYTTDIPAEDVGELDEEARTLWIRADAPLEDRLWQLRQCWDFLAIGPHASPSAQLLPRLRLVIPPPRPADDQSA
jgi:hypothetical protein